MLGVHSTHAPTRQTGRVPEHGSPTSCQVPDAVHSWGCTPLQLNAPTEQPASSIEASCKPASSTVLDPDSEPVLESEPLPDPELEPVLDPDPLLDPGQPVQSP